jgi:hypothetical protein
MWTRQNSLNIDWPSYEFDGMCPGCDLCRDCGHAHRVGSHHHCGEPRESVSIQWHPDGYSYLVHHPMWPKDIPWIEGDDPVFPSHDSRSEPLTREKLMELKDKLMKQGFVPDRNPLDLIAGDYRELEIRALALGFLDYPDVIHNVHDARIYEGTYDKLKAIVKEWEESGGKILTTLDSLGTAGPIEARHNCAVCGQIDCDHIRGRERFEEQSDRRMIRDTVKKALEGLDEKGIIQPTVDTITVKKCRKVEPGVYVDMVIPKPISPSWEDVPQLVLPDGTAEPPAGFDYFAEDERRARKERMQWFDPRPECKCTADENGEIHRAMDCPRIHEDPETCEKCGAPITAINTDGKCHCDD